jgi:hypothetical protein
VIGCQAPLDVKLIVNKSHNVTDERSILQDQLTKKSPNSPLCWPQILYHHLTKGWTITYTICGRDRRLCVDKSLIQLHTNVNYFARLVINLVSNLHYYLQWTTADNRSNWVPDCARLLFFWVTDCCFFSWKKLNLAVLIIFEFWKKI